MVIFERRVPDLTELALSRFVDRVRVAAGLTGRVVVLITSNSEMKALNQRFRGVNKATDVLSFPVSAEGGLRKGLAGEIAISADIARGNARALGHGAAEEVKILVLHGILHLRGYDHESDQGQMARREARMRAKLRLPTGLIERGIDGKSGRKTLLGEQVRSAAKAAVNVAAPTARVKARPFQAGAKRSKT